MAEGLSLEDALRRFTTLLLDTNVLITEFKTETGRLRDINRPQRATSVVAVWEFVHGGQGALFPGDERRDRRAWLGDQGIVALPLSPGAGKMFERFLEMEGPPSVADALLAAECLALEIPVVTSNVKDFKGVPGLHYVVW